MDKNKSIGITYIDTNDLIGKQFGELEVISYLGSTHDRYNSEQPTRKRHWYLCYCKACGNCKPVERSPLRQNICHSCGCKSIFGQKTFARYKIVEELFKQGKLGT